MNKYLEYLLQLQQIDIQIKEKEVEEKIGFKFDNIEKLKDAREKIIEKLGPQLYNKYERIKNAYGNSVVPVVNGICLGCFSVLPTALVSQKDNNEKIINCPNCGRFLTWLE